MFHIRSEGADLSPGLNFYPLSDTGSIGVRLMIDTKNKSHVYGFRWSKFKKRFHYWTVHVDKETARNMYS